MTFRIGEVVKGAENRAMLFSGNHLTERPHSGLREENRTREMIPLPLILAAITNGSESVSCLDNIIARYFDKTVLLVVEGDALPQHDSIRSLRDRAVVLYGDEKPEINHILRDYDLVIFGPKHGRDLSRMFRGKHSGKIVVTVEQTSSHLARHFISTLWDLTRSTDVIVLAGGNSSAEVYSWFPYRERECSEVKEIVLMDTWRNGSFIRGVNLFPEKLKDDLNGCPLSVSTRPIAPYVFEQKASGQNVEGYEVLMVNDLIREFNMSLRIVRPASPHQLWSTDTGRKHRDIFRFLTSHEIDLAFGGMMARADRYELTDAAYPYGLEYLLWMYPKPPFETNFSSIYTVFAPELWVAVLLFHVFITAVLFLAVKSAREIHYTGLVSCFFNAVAVLFNTNTPPPKSTFLRFTVMSYVIYALHLSAAYQSYLVVLLTHSKRNQPFRDINQLADSRMMVYLFSPVQHLYNETEHSAWSKILRPGRVKYFDKMNASIVNDIAVNRSRFLLFPKNPLTFLTRITYPDGGKSLFEYLQYLTYPMTMYFSPGNPLQNPFSKHIQSLFEAGILRYWEKVTMASAWTGGGQVLAPAGEDSDFPQALCMKHLEGAFLLLGLFLAFSFFAFLGELLLHRMSRELVFSRRKRHFRTYFDLN